jgi:DNA-binding NarL/FixJ family response regulator
MKKGRDLNPDRRVLTALVARLEPIRSQILERWAGCLREELGGRGEAIYHRLRSIPSSVLREGNVAEFCKFLSAELEPFVQSEELAYKDLLLVFHLFKESLYPYLQREGATSEELFRTFTSLDRLYHHTLSATASTFLSTVSEDAKRRKEMSEKKGLTKREAEIVKWVAEGYKNREIAGQLGISIKTVETHRANIMNKLGLRNLSQLIRYALQKGLIQIDKA